MATVRNIDDFIKHIGRSKNKLNAEDINKVKVFRITIETEINNVNSSLSIYLRSLSETDKITLIRAMICNDHDVIKEMIEPALTKELQDMNAGSDIVSEIASVLDNDQNLWLNSTSESIINMLLNNSNNKRLTKNDVNRILTNVMAKIPDTDINVSTKAQISQFIDTRQKHLFVEYNQPVHILERNVSTGIVSLNDLKLASKSKKFDRSEYILLVLGLLQRVAEDNHEMSAFITDLKRSYYNTNYEHAIKRIKDVCDRFESNIYAFYKQDAASIIKEAGRRSSEVNTDTNYSRRFFENRIASLYFGQGMNLESINKINTHFMGEKYGGNYTNANNISEAIAGISALTESESIDGKLTKRRLEIRSNVDLMKHKGRHIKKGFSPKDTEAYGNESLHEVFSRNLGTMKSSQPNYSSDISESDLRNTNPDINDYDRRDTEYPMMRKRSAYVASISGHALAVVTMLERYAQENKTSPTLQEDINNYIHAFMATYAGRGYHSLLEVSDIFNHSAVRNVFKQLDISLDLSWPKMILDQAFMDTQSYTRELVVQRAMRSELMAHLDIFDAIYENDTKRIQKILERMDSNEKNNTNQYGNTVLHYLVKSNDIDLIKVLLSDDKINLNLMNYEGESALYIAIKNNRPDIVEQLLNHGANPYLVHKAGSSALELAKATNNVNDKIIQIIESTEDRYSKFFHAVKSGNIANVMEMINDRSINIHLANRYGDNALHLAIKTGQIEMLKVLIDAGLNTYIHNKDGYNAFQLAIKEKNTDIFFLLLDKKCVEDPLHIAIKMNDIDAVNLILNDDHLDPNIANIPNKENVTPLMLAANMNMPETVSALLGHQNIKIDAMDKKGRTALFYASSSGNTEVVKLLLSNNSHPGIRDISGKSPYDYAKTKEIRNLIHYEQIFAEFENCYVTNNMKARDLVIRDLKDHTYIKDVRGNTLLHYSVLYGDLDSVAKLIANGAKINERNDSGSTALMVAIENKHHELIKTLLENDNINPNISNNDGYTPLMQAVLNKDKDAVSALLDNKNIIINAITKEGVSALHLASNSGDHEMVELLLSHGANLFLRDSAGKIAIDYASENMVIDKLDKSVKFYNDQLIHNIKLGNIDEVNQILKFMQNTILNDSIALHVAAAHGHDEIVKRLLICYANPLSKDESGKTPMDYAVTDTIKELMLNEVIFSRLESALQRNDQEELSRLKNDLKANPNNKDVFDNSYLNAAIHYDNNELISYLLDNNANPNIQHKDGMTPLMIAAEINDINLIKILLLYGADPGIEDKHENTVFDYIKSEEIKEILLTALRFKTLSTALANKDQRELSRLESVFKSYPDKTDVFGNTYLHAAIQYGNTAIATFLLKNNANSNISNRDGVTPLMLAAQTGNLEMVQLLLSHGANPNLQNEHGKAAYHYANTEVIKNAIISNIIFTQLDTALLQNDQNQLYRLEYIFKDNPDRTDTSGNTYLHIAIKHNNIDNLEHLLSINANPNIRNNAGQTPLVAAIKSNNIEAIKSLLLNDRIDPNIPDRYGNPPVIDAVLYNKNDVLAALLQNQKIDIDVSNQDANALYFATEEGNLEAVRLLINYGADPFMPNKHGGTPFSAADQYNYPEIAVLLAVAQLNIAIERYEKMCRSPDTKQKSLDYAKNDIDNISANLDAARIKCNLKKRGDGSDQKMDIKSTADLIKKIRLNPPPLPDIPQVREIEKNDSPLQPVDLPISPILDIKQYTKNIDAQKSTINITESNSGEIKLNEINSQNKILLFRNMLNENPSLLNHLKQIAEKSHFTKFLELINHVTVASEPDIKKIESLIHHCYERRTPARFSDNTMSAWSLWVIDVLKILKSDTLEGRDVFEVKIKEKLADFSVMQNKYYDAMKTNSKNEDTSDTDQVRKTI